MEPPDMLKCLGPDSRRQNPAQEWNAWQRMMSDVSAIFARVEEKVKVVENGYYSLLRGVTNYPAFLALILANSVKQMAHNCKQLMK